MNISKLAARLLALLMCAIAVLLVVLVVLVFPLYAWLMVVWLHAPQTEVVLFTTVAAFMVLLVAWAIDALRRKVVRCSTSRNGGGV